jgi:hypothetical protein
MRKARDGKQRSEKGAKGDRFSGAQYRGGKGASGDVLGTASKYEPFAYVALGTKGGAGAFAGVMASTTKAGKHERRGSLKRGIVAERSADGGAGGAGGDGGEARGRKRRERERD